jgi:hypothetical protein
MNEMEWKGTFCKLQKRTYSMSYWYVQFCLGLGLCVQVKGVPQLTCFEITTTVFNVKTTQQKTIQTKMLFQLTLHTVLLKCVKVKVHRCLYKGHDNSKIRTV